MKANSRRRVLISSMCMLMVALVALSTATFAWFTESKTATADGILAKTAQVSSLQIASADGAYGPSFKYNFSNSSMMPASSLNGKNWFYAVAEKADNYAAKDTTTVKTVEDANKGNFVFVEQLNIKNAGTTAVKNVTVQVNGFGGHTYARFALVPVAAKGSANINTVTEDAFKANVYAADKTAYAPISAEGVIPGEGAPVITPTAVTEGYKITAAETLAKGDEVHYNLYVWFEGQDAECINTAAGTGLDNLSFTVTGEEVTD